MFIGDSLSKTSSLQKDQKIKGINLILFYSMSTFEDFKIKKQLFNAIDDLGFVKPTPIQEQSYSAILAGRDFVGIAQTGTGKTIAYLLPILQDLPKCSSSRGLWRN